MLGSAKDQFNAWVQEDEPFRQVMSSPTLTREPKFINIASLPDSTVVVEFVTTTTEDGYKPRKQRYTITFRYQTKPADKRLSSVPIRLGCTPFSSAFRNPRPDRRAHAHGRSYPSRFIPLSLRCAWPLLLSAPDSHAADKMRAAPAPAWQESASVTSVMP
jgi:hypothetical protein